MTTKTASSLSIREIQLAELAILKQSVQFFEKNHLSYWLYGGTLLGAIRHQGFIPWDDDIDIIMPRPDYEKLLNIMKNTQNKIGPFELHAVELENSNHLCPKIIDERINIEQEGHVEKNLWIDIFPLDGLPDSKPERYLRKISRYKNTFYMRALSYEHQIYPKSIIKKEISQLRRLLNLDKTIKKLNKMAKKFSYEDAKTYVCDTVWAVHPGNILKKEWLDTTIKMPFEDTEVNVFGGYKYYLENRYGKDYMKIPPEDKRETHHIRAYRIDKKANI